ncbi:hypothetical protein [Streptomyces sp. NPDC058620]|uniref:hypothetical protein n=1 Tax=Streptomyces sp. NPDC058620 TaxID=3346560 RepID=UPI00365CC86E
MNRATSVLAEGNARVEASPVAALGRQRGHELTELRQRLRKSNEDRRRLQEQVDAAASVTAALLAENATLREQAARRSAVIMPITRTHGGPPPAQ